MTYEEAEELHDNIQNAPSVPRPDGTSRIFDGLVILRKYDPKADIESAGQDQVYAGQFSEAISEEDLTALFHLGWGIEDGYFHHFT